MLSMSFMMLSCAERNIADGFKIFVQYLCGNLKFLHFSLI